MVPVSGSAYTYAYATLGELVGWIIGWDLIIEYAVGNVAVAISWSGYFQELLRNVGIHFPDWLAVDYRSAAQAAAQVAETQAKGGSVEALGGAILQAANALATAPHLLGIPLVFNLPAFLIVMLITVVLVVGIRESAWFNSAMVLLKLAIIAFFIIMGFFYVKTGELASVRAQRLSRDLHGRRDHLLRLHRLRRRLHGRRGDQEPAARHADRHHLQPRSPARSSTSWWRWC